jgi:hypothetical protein
MLSNTKCSVSPASLAAPLTTACEAPSRAAGSKRDFGPGENARSSTPVPNSNWRCRATLSKGYSGRWTFGELIDDPRKRKSEKPENWSSNRLGFPWKGVLLPAPVLLWTYRATARRSGSMTPAPCKPNCRWLLRATQGRVETVRLCGDTGKCSGSSSSDSLWRLTLVHALFAACRYDAIPFGNRRRAASSSTEIIRNFSEFEVRHPH